MEFSLLHKDEKHVVTIATSDMHIKANITRIKMNGGRIETIIAKFDPDITFSECMRRIHNIVRLESDIYAIAAEHTKQMEAEE